MDNEEPRILGDGRPLTMKWSKRERDVTISYPRSCDGHLMAGVLSGHNRDDLMKELDRRGYDLTTLRFSIKQKAVVAQKRAEKNK
jgi:hypothetical protein